MVLPVTGPVVESKSEPYADSYQRRYRQAPPYDLPLIYEAWRNYGRQDVSYIPGGSWRFKAANFTHRSFVGFDWHETAAKNLAYERLKSKVSESAGWAETLAQINKTRTTLVDRCEQLLRLVLALRRADFKYVAKALKTPMPSKVSNRKAASQNFLEWEYGIKPLLLDIQATTEVLLTDFGVKYYKGVGRSALETNDSVTMNGPTVFSTRVTVSKGNVLVAQRTGVKIVNPNVFLLNQLGLIDIALPWKLMPFSFVVDWFVNIEQVISSVTDWYGVNLIHPHTSVLWTTQSHMQHQGLSLQYAGGPVVSKGVEMFAKHSFEMRRSMGLTRPVFAVKPFKGFSVQRGAQAIALVLAVFGK